MPDRYDLMSLFANNFGLAMFVLAVFFILFHKAVTRGRVSNEEIVYRWMALLPLGVAGIHAFINYLFYPEAVDITLGWAQSPFQYQVAIARLALGVVAILSFNASFGFRLATVIANVTYLLGVAYLHIYHLVLHGVYNLNNVNSWLWLDNLVLPLVLFLCMNSLSREDRS